MEILGFIFSRLIPTSLNYLFDQKAARSGQETYFNFEREVADLLIAKVKSRDISATALYSSIVP